MPIADPAAASSNRILSGRSRDPAIASSRADGATILRIGSCSLGGRHGDQATTEQPPALRKPVAVGKLCRHRVLAGFVDALVSDRWRCDAGLAGDGAHPPSRLAYVAGGPPPPNDRSRNGARRDSGGMAVSASWCHLPRLVAPGLLPGARTFRAGASSATRRLRARMVRSRPFRFSARESRSLLLCCARGCRRFRLRSHGQGGDWSSGVAIRSSCVALVRPLVSVCELALVFCGPTRPWSRRAPQRRSRLKVTDAGQTQPWLVDGPQDAPVGGDSR